MLIQKLFSVHDSKAEVYLPPMMLRTKGEAIRNIAQAAKTPNTSLHDSPSDFTLVELGEYNQISGELIPYDKPIIMGNVSEFLQNPQA